MTCRILNGTPSVPVWEFNSIACLLLAQLKLTAYCLITNWTAVAARCQGLAGSVVEVAGKTCLAIRVTSTDNCLYCILDLTRVSVLFHCFGCQYQCSWFAGKAIDPLCVDCDINSLKNSSLSIVVYICLYLLSHSAVDCQPSAAGKRKSATSLGAKQTKKRKLEVLPNPLDATWIHPESYELADKWVSSVCLNWLISPSHDWCEFIYLFSVKSYMWYMEKRKHLKVQYKKYTCAEQ